MNARNKSDRPLDFAIEEAPTHVEAGRVRHADPDLGHDGRARVAVDVRHVSDGSRDCVLDGGDTVAAPGVDPRGRQDRLKEEQTSGRDARTGHLLGLSLHMYWLVGFRFE